jgi:hypothetical protein
LSCARRSKCKAADASGTAAPTRRWRWLGARGGGVGRRADCATGGGCWIGEGVGGVGRRLGGAGCAMHDARVRGSWHLRIGCYVCGGSLRDA